MSFLKRLIQSPLWWVLVMVVWVLALLGVFASMNIKTGQVSDPGFLIALSLTLFVGVMKIVGGILEAKSLFSASGYKKWAEMPDYKISAKNFINLKAAATSALIDYNDGANAEKIADKALKFKPEDPDICYLKGMIAQFSHNDVPHAIEWYTKAIEHAGEAREAPMYKDAHEFYSARADAYDYMHKYNEAIADFSKCLEYDPKNVRNLLRRAEVYSKIDQKDKAIADIKKALEIEPGNSKAQEMLKKLQR